MSITEIARVFRVSLKIKNKKPFLEVLFTNKQLFFKSIFQLN